MKVYSLMLSILSCLSIFIVGLEPTDVKAQYLRGPVAQGYGGAGRAATEVGEAVLFNPAAVPHGPEFSATALLQTGSITATQEDQTYGVSLVDNGEGVMFPGALTYLKREREFSDQFDIEEHFGQFVLGNFAIDNVAVGFGFQWLRQTIASAAGDDHEDTFGGSFGILWTPHEQLGLGFSMLNLGRAKADVPEYARYPMNWGAGLVYIYQIFKFRADASRAEQFNPDQKWRLSLGMESNLAPYLALRVGLRDDQLLKQRAYSIGLALNGPRFKLDYAYDNPEGTQARALHSIDIRVPY